MALHLTRTHLAILISLIGTGSLSCRSAIAQDDASLHRSAVPSVASSESSIRAALGLASTSNPGPSAASHRDDAADETRVRWTLSILPSPPDAKAPAARAASQVGPNPKSTVAGVHALPRPTPGRRDERPTVDEPEERPASAEAAFDTPAVEQTVLADRAQPAHELSPLPDVEATDGGAAALLTTPRSAPRPRRRGDHQPNTTIADAPSSKSRRSTLWTSTTLTLPPDHAWTNRGGARAGSRERPASRFLARANSADPATKDPLVSLLQVLDDRGFDAVHRDLPTRVAVAASDANEARIASDVFARIADEAERFAASQTLVTAAAEPQVVDIVDTIAASEATVSEPTIVVAGRFLPMHLLDVLDGDVIDPAGALPVQALLVRPAVPALDARPIHALLPVQPTVADARSGPASIAALRSFFDDRSAMRFAETAEGAPSAHRATTQVAALVEPMFETLDFPPLFDEPPVFAKLQVGTRVEPALPVVAMTASASGPRFISSAADARPSISYDIFDPKLDVPTTGQDDRPRPVAAQSTPVDEIQSIVRGRSDSAVPTARDEPRPDPLHGMLALADSQLEDMRGGFETDSGLRISFGIERAVYVNGSLVTTTSLNVADLSRLTAGQAQSMGIDRATLGVIQSGANNTFTPAQLGTGNVATVIQNTLNDQKIQGITQINATVNSLDVIRRSDVQARIQSALTDSIRR